VIKIVPSAPVACRIQDENGRFFGFRCTVTMDISCKIMNYLPAVVFYGKSPSVNCYDRHEHPVVLSKRLLFAPILLGQRRYARKAWLAGLQLTFMRIISPGF
jgi:hypothetical protein